jgi:hypothetical protein
LRRRARTTPDALAVARRTLAAVGGIEAGRWTAAFMKDEIIVRGRRVLA